MSQSSVPLSTDNRRPSSTARSRQSRVDSTSSSNRSAGLRSRPVIIVMTAAYLLLCFQVVQTRETIISAGAKAGQQTEDSRHCPPDASLISAGRYGCVSADVCVCVFVCAPVKGRHSSVQLGFETGTATDMPLIVAIHHMLGRRCRCGCRLHLILLH